MPRQLITDRPDIDTSDLPELTEKQFRFVEGIAAGLSSADAYRRAYDCAGSGNNTVWVEASRLKASPSVSLWLAALQAAGFAKVKITREDHLAELERLRNLAERSGNIGAAVQAEQLRGKVAGHYVEKMEHSQGPMDTASKLAALADKNPELAELAKSIAAKHGLDLKHESDTRH